MLSPGAEEEDGEDPPAPSSSAAVALPPSTASTVDPMLAPAVASSEEVVWAGLTGETPGSLDGEIAGVNNGEFAASGQFLAEPLRTLALLEDNITSRDDVNAVPTRYPLIRPSKGFASLLGLLKRSPNWTDIEVIVGSSFAGDSERDPAADVFEIQRYLEAGKKVLLVNSANTYESIYDALNQYYTIVEDRRYVQMGLGVEKPMCRVATGARLILVDADAVNLPTPLLNRLEKYRLTARDLLQTEVERQLASALEQWAKDWANNRKTDFQAQVVLGGQTVDQTRGQVDNDFATFVGWDREETPAIIAAEVFAEYWTKPEALLSGSGGYEDGVDVVVQKLLPICQRRLLQTATPEAVLHYFLVGQKGNLETFQAYFQPRAEALQEGPDPSQMDIDYGEMGQPAALGTIKKEWAPQMDIVLDEEMVQQPAALEKEQWAPAEKMDIDDGEYESADHKLGHECVAASSSSTCALPPRPRSTSPRPSKEEGQLSDSDGPHHHDQTTFETAYRSLQSVLQIGFRKRVQQFVQMTTFAGVVTESQKQTLSDYDVTLLSLDQTQTQAELREAVDRFAHETIVRSGVGRSSAASPSTELVEELASKQGNRFVEISCACIFFLRTATVCYTLVLLRRVVNIMSCSIHDERRKQRFLPQNPLGELAEVVEDREGPFVPSAEQIVGEEPPSASPQKPRVLLIQTVAAERLLKTVGNGAVDAASALQRGSGAGALRDKEQVDAYNRLIEASRWIVNWDGNRLTKKLENDFRSFSDHLSKNVLAVPVRTFFHSKDR